jgi:hypothetical protein
MMAAELQVLADAVLVEWRHREATARSVGGGTGVRADAEGDTWWTSSRWSWLIGRY